MSGSADAEATVIPSLETQRLWLRPLTLQDADQLQARFPHWEIVRLLAAAVPWPYPPDGALAWCRDVALPQMAAGEAWHWTIRLKGEPDQVIGAISLMRAEGNNRGFWIGLEWQGQGFATEAAEAVTDFWFDVLKFPVLRAPKAVANLASRRISEKLNMRVVATEERDHVSGRALDEIWETTAEEWRARPRPGTPTRWLAFGLLVFLITPLPAFGQGAPASVAATYTVLHDTETERTFDRGVSVAGTCRVYRWLYVAAEAAFSDHHEDYSSTQGGTYEFRYQSLQAGPRASPRMGRVQPYVELLAGVTRQGIWERRLDNTGGWGSAELSVQPGLGVDLFVARRVALRLAGDVRLVFRHDNRFDTDYRAKLYRLNVGLALHLGE